MDDYRDTPPYSGPQTPKIGPVDAGVKCDSYEYGTPTSMSFDTRLQTPQIPANLTQDMVEADPELKRFQQDLLILTSFNENETLHFRPSWFKQAPYSKQFWTLYNPPNVVTEFLSGNRPRKWQKYTRRMRRASDSLPSYIKTWDDWYRVCDLRGVPRDFLCKEQVELMRLAPPMWPLYPEPQPKNQGRYILNDAVYLTHLPPKFFNVYSKASIEDREAVIVHSDGTLAIEPREEYFFHSSQTTHFGGTGDYVADPVAMPDDEVPKDQGKSRRWSHFPWTREMEESSRLENPSGLKIRLRDWNWEMKLLALRTAGTSRTSGRSRTPGKSRKSKGVRRR